MVLLRGLIIYVCRKADAKGSPRCPLCSTSSTANIVGRGLPRCASRCCCRRPRRPPASRGRNERRFFPSGGAESKLSPPCLGICDVLAGARGWGALSLERRRHDHGRSKPAPCLRAVAARYRKNISNTYLSRKTERTHMHRVARRQIGCRVTLVNRATAATITFESNPWRCPSFVQARSNLPSNGPNFDADSADCGKHYVTVPGSAEFSLPRESCSWRKPFHRQPSID